MELSEKLQALRRARGLTQEQLAQQLYVSRTAVSKWETGRGTPNIDSLMALAEVFGVSLDELLSGEELLTLAQDEKRGDLRRLGLCLCGGLDLGALAGVFLPLYGVRVGEVIYPAPLYAYADRLQGPYAVVLLALALCGAAELAALWLGREEFALRLQRLGLVLHCLTVLFFILTRQPYAGALFFLFLLLKALLWRRGRARSQRM